VRCEGGKLLRPAQSAGVDELLDLLGDGVLVGVAVKDRRVEAADNDGVDADAATGELSSGREGKAVGFPRTATDGAAFRLDVLASTLSSQHQE
jgi:hypothetical protein